MGDLTSPWIGRELQEQSKSVVLHQNVSPVDRLNPHVCSLGAPRGLHGVRILCAPHRLCRRAGGRLANTSRLLECVRVADQFRLAERQSREVTPYGAGSALKPGGNGVGGATGGGGTTGLTTNPPGTTTLG
jgi:hypothetical protein